MMMLDEETGALDRSRLRSTQSPAPPDTAMCLKARWPPDRTATVAAPQAS
jgi:hypothetical protein